MTERPGPSTDPAAETSLTIVAIEAFHVVARDRSYWNEFKPESRASTERHVLGVRFELTEVLHLRQSQRGHLPCYFTGCRLSYCAANPGTDNAAYASARGACASVTLAIMLGGLKDEHSG